MIMTSATSSMQTTSSVDASSSQYKSCRNSVVNPSAYAVESLCSMNMTVSSASLALHSQQAMINEANSSSLCSSSDSETNALRSQQHQQKRYTHRQQYRNVSKHSHNKLTRNHPHRRHLARTQAPQMVAQSQEPLVPVAVEVKRPIELVNTEKPKALKQAIGVTAQTAARQLLKFFSRQKSTSSATTVNALVKEPTKTVQEQIPITPSLNQALPTPPTSSASTGKSSAFSSILTSKKIAKFIMKQQQQQQQQQQEQQQNRISLLATVLAAHQESSEKCVRTMSDENIPFSSASNSKRLQPIQVFIHSN